MCIYVKLLKHTGQGKSQASIVFQVYDRSDALCIVKNLQEYLHRTASLRGDNTAVSQLPEATQACDHRHHCTLAEKHAALCGCGRGVSAYSTRVVATSAAKQSGLALDQIMKCAGWTNASTFGRFYDKPCSSTHSFCESILP